MTDPAILPDDDAWTAEDEAAFERAQGRLVLWICCTFFAAVALILWAWQSGRL